MNKKIIKILGIITCGLGGGLSVSSLSTSCSKSSTSPLPSDLVYLPENVTQSIFNYTPTGALRGFVDNCAQIINQYPKANTIKIPESINGVKITSIAQSGMGGSTDIGNINTLIIPSTISECAEYACLENSHISRIIFESEFTQISSGMGNPTQNIVQYIYYPANSIEQIKLSLSESCFHSYGANAPDNNKWVISTGKMSSAELCEILKQDYGLPSAFNAK